MILALSTYYLPFRAILIKNDGSIGGIYRHRTDESEKNGFYPFPIQNIINAILSQNVALNEINDVLIFGKPMLYFEKLLKDSIVPPGIRKGLRFGEDVSFFMGKIFRIKRDIDVALRFTPNYSFISALESYRRIPTLLGWEKDVFFWGCFAEFAHSAYINYDKRETVLMNDLHSQYERYLNTEPPEKRNEILEEVLNSMNFKTGMLITNPVKGSKPVLREEIAYCFDSPTLALAAMCDLYFASTNVNAEIPNTFRNEFIASTTPATLGAEIAIHGEHNFIDIS